MEAGYELLPSKAGYDFLPSPPTCYRHIEVRYGPAGKERMNAVRITEVHSPHAFYLFWLTPLAKPVSEGRNSW